MTTDFCLIYVTTPSQTEARKLGKALVTNKLCACVNILPGMVSNYFWQNKVQSAQECVLLIKTKKALYKKVETFIKAHHSYECPCIIQLAIDGGAKDYLEWITETTS